jgi:ATP-dependent exoDNAse (exonuclease V) beta subunit
MEALALEVRRLVDAGYQVVDKESKSLRTVRPADIAILCRGNDRVDVVLKALTKAAVPYATGAAGLLGRPESVLALACLRRLHDPGDTIATAEILSLADCAEPEQWLADRLEYLAQNLPKAEWREVGDRAHPLLARIADLRKELALLSPHEAIERVIGGCDLVPRILQWCSSEAEARQRIANVDALLVLATAYEDSCRATGTPGSVSGLMRWFGEQADAEKDQQPTLAADAVQVLTHHAAKGLEWPIVILVDLDCETRDRCWGISVRSDCGLDVTAPLAGRFIQFRPWPFGKMKKVSLREIVANAAAGQAARKAAIEEDSRLLYVSMTRARDLMVVALPKVEWNNEQWLGLTGAPWLLPEQDNSGVVRFPVDRKLWQFRHCGPASEDQAPAKKQAISLHWFADVAAVGDRSALRFSPSSAEPIAFAPPVPEFIGKNIALAHGYDSTAVGTALHAVMAASLGVSGPLSREEIAALLERYQVSGSANPDEVHAFVVAFREWLTSRWPSAAVTAEVPVRARMADGRIMVGQIDLLLQNESGTMILDYKSGHLSPDKTSDKLQRYAGQLQAYSDAVRGAGAVRTYLLSTNDGLILECQPQGASA